MLLIVRFIVPQTLECWPGLQVRRSLQNWSPMIRLAIPGFVMIFAEWLAFDILTFSASYLSTAHLAAQSAVMSVSIMMFHIPFPMSIAASTRFGNLIGYGALSAARIAWKAHYAVFVAIGVFDIILLTSLRHIIPLIFTKDEQVRTIITAILPIVAAVQLADALTALSNGLIRGMGRQKVGGWVNLGVYYLFAIPLSFLLAFGPPHWELAGLWTGPCLGLACTFVILFTYMRLADWESAVEEARAREEQGF